MPYLPHHAFSIPEDGEQPIWRYLDVPRFLSLVQSSSLHFARADKLGDPFEGSISAATFANSIERVPSIARAFQLKSAVNCWHMNRHESVAMWTLYGKSEMAIAVRSTVGRLIRALKVAQQEVFIGVVSYIDYDEHAMNLENHFRPLLCKRRSFMHEQELRAITVFPAPAGTWDNANNPEGQLVPVDVNELIESVYVAPQAPTWFASTIAETLRRLAFVKLSVRQSRIDEDPMF